MALPVILVNSATGSDSAASGAGPATALTGTSAATDGAGTLVTLDGSPDLSGVATDGSHVIYLDDSTSGARNFGKITAKDDGAKTVTVGTAFGLSLSGKSWAIGGKRATIAGTNSLKLFDNNSAAGDALPGWTVEMESGHAETIASTFNIRRDGDLASGNITLRGTAGAATPPILTFSNNGQAITLANNLNSIALRAFELKNTNATKTASVGVRVTGSSADYVHFDGLKIADATNNFATPITSISNASATITNCEIGYAAGVGIDTTTETIVNNCYIHDCTSHGISGTASKFDNNLIVRNGGDGINTTYSTPQQNMSIVGNVIHGNAGDGIELTQNVRFSGSIKNNALTYNGGYGLKFHASMTAAGLAAGPTQVLNNGHYANSSGFCSVTGAGVGSVNADPSAAGTSAANDYQNASGGSNFMVGTAFKALGYPVAGTNAFALNSDTNSYVDIGPQRLESGGGGSVANRGIMSGGAL